MALREVKNCWNNMKKILRNSASIDLYNAGRFMIIRQLVLILKIYMSQDGKIASQLYWIKITAFIYIYIHHLESFIKIGIFGIFWNSLLYYRQKTTRKSKNIKKWLFWSAKTYNYVGYTDRNDIGLCGQKSSDLTEKKQKISENKQKLNKLKEF